MKRKNVCLTKSQQELVTAHISIVHWVIRENIRINKNAFGYGYEDLFQEGCFWLCRAAITYDVTLAQFRTYAKTVVRNGLYSYCRQPDSQQGHYTYFSENEYGELTVDGKELTDRDTFEQQLSLLETLDLLESCAQHYNGIAKLGIKALELKIKGLSVTEIARLYDVPASHVGAWISHSKEKLKEDPVFLSGIT